MSIDSLYSGVLEELTSQGKIIPVSKKLLTAKTNDERVLYVYEIIESLNRFPKVQVVSKCQKVSTHYRYLGNIHFQKFDDYKAWQYYNLSLLYAPPDSDSYSLAIANRSAVFYSLQKYQECLKDIDKLFFTKHPDKLKEKLLKRQASCKDAISKEEGKNSEENSEVAAILSFNVPKDERFLCASPKLEVVYNEEMGRHVLAKQDIGVGEILVQEEPYLTLLMKDQYLWCCSYCLSRSLNLLPCPKCCYALYCSEQCRENAWREYHIFECSLMPTLVYMEFTKLELLGIRITIKSRTDHSDWLSLFKTIEDAESTVNSDHWGHVKVNDKWVYDSKYYSSIHTLATNVEKRSISDVFQKSVTAAVFLYLLSCQTDFLKADDMSISEKIKRCIAGSLLLHIMTSPTNMHGISSNIQTADGNYMGEVNIASAPYAFHSLLNHSCAPNVVRFSKSGSGQMSLFALRPIKKGMQLFDNYGSHHALQDRGTRQESLKFQYKFVCMCEACVNDWPTYLCMSTNKTLPPTLRQRKDKLLRFRVIENLQKGDPYAAVKIYRPLCELLQDLEHYAPCMELADGQESLKQCLAIFTGLVPYGYSLKVEWYALPPKV